MSHLTPLDTPLVTTTTTTAAVTASNPTVPTLTLSQLSHHFAESAHLPPTDTSFLFTSPNVSSLTLAPPRSSSPARKITRRRPPPGHGHTKSSSTSTPAIAKVSATIPASDTSWLDRRFFFRQYTMGQGQGKLEAGSSHTRSQQDGLPSEPHSPFNPYIEQLQSLLPTAQPMQAEATDATWSRIDYGPGPSKPPPAGPTAYESRRVAGLARKLSKARIKRNGSTESRRGSEEGTPKTEPEPAGSKSTSPQSSHFLQSTKTMKASTFSARKRMSNPPSPTSLPSVAPSPGLVPAPTPSPAPKPFPLLTGDLSPFSLPVMTTLPPRTTSRPAAPQPPHTPRNSRHRKSTSSGRSSIKSPRRAEREWRAKVAALSFTLEPSSSPYASFRGPVPPPRPSITPSNSKLGPMVSTQSSPDDEHVVTPLSQRSPPAKSFSSNRSFATLGHHIHLQAEYRDPHGNDTSFLSINSREDRKTSIAPSVSSFYFDPNGSRVSTRPSSVAADRLFLPLRAADSPTPSSPLANQETPRPSPTEANFTPASSQRSRRPLPPFASFQISPVNVGDGFDISPTSPTNSAPTPVPSSSAALHSPHAKSLKESESSSRRHSMPSGSPGGRDVRFFSLPTGSSTPDRTEAGKGKTNSNLSLDFVSAKRHSQQLGRSPSPATPTSQRIEEEGESGEGQDKRVSRFSPSPTTAYILSARSIGRIAWTKGLNLTDKEPASPCANKGQVSRWSDDSSIVAVADRGAEDRIRDGKEENGKRPGSSHPFSVDRLEPDRVLVKGKQQSWTGQPLFGLGYDDVTLSPLPPLTPPIPPFTPYEVKHDNQSDPFFVPSASGAAAHREAEAKGQGNSSRRGVQAETAMGMARQQSRREPHAHAHTHQHHHRQQVQQSQQYQHHHHTSQYSQQNQQQTIQYSMTVTAGRALKSEVLGTSSVTNRVELVPGRRPPKSGLPMDDLQRWLAQTSITS